MRVSFVCVGRLARPCHLLWRHYEELLRPYVTVEVLEAPEEPLAHGVDRAREKESSALLGLLRKGAYTVVLDARGRQYSSEEWSAFLAERKLEGWSHFQFVLGGPAGMDERVLGAAHLVWSLSKLTFPHQLARCLVAEQLYRALRIERREPYHW